MKPKVIIKIKGYEVVYEFDPVTGVGTLVGEVRPEDRETVLASLEKVLKKLNSEG